MPSDFISDDVRRLILSRIDSIAHLEALLLLRDHAEKEWSVQTMAARLYIPADHTGVLLDRLTADGFAAVRQGDPPRYHYQPQSSELARLVDGVAEDYAKHLIEVTKLVHSKQSTKVQSFADAFKLRKESS